MKKYDYKNDRYQKGATLIVSLVILTIVTILGLASMRNSNLELKMAASTRDHSIAFQNAESALRVIEKRISHELYSYTRNQLESDCVDAVSCFDPTCAGGLCFAGEFDKYTEQKACKLSINGLPAQQMWKNANIWVEGSGLYSEIDIPNSKTPDDPAVANPVRYLVEFLCFVPAPNAGADGDDDAMLPLYRITVRSDGEAGRSIAMLQSVYRGAALATVVPGGAGAGI